MSTKIILLLLLGSLLTACGKALPETETRNHTEPSSSQSGYTAILKKLPERTIKNEVFNSCMTEAVNSCSYDTALQTARMHSDTNFCNDMLTEDMKIQCQTLIVTEKAIKNNSIALCDALTAEDQKGMCQMEITKQQGVRENSTDSCKNLSGDNRDSCFLQIISVKKDASPEECNDIQDESLKRMCISMTTEK